MRAILVAACLHCASATAADFRGTDFGTSCAAIDERESALGSTKLSADIPVFRGQAFGRDVRITYLCRDGLLEVGDYHFPNQTYDHAVADYIAAHGQYSSAYGSPSLVYSKPGVPPVFPAVGAVAPSQYHASWHVDGLVVHVDFMLARDGTDANWFVAVVISEANK